MKKFLGKLLVWLLMGTVLVVFVALIMFSVWYKMAKFKFFMGM